MTNSRFSFGEGSLLIASKSFAKHLFTLAFVMSVMLTDVFGTIVVTSTPDSTNDYCGTGGPTLTLPVVATSNCGAGTITYKWYVGSVSGANQITSAGSPNYSGWTTSTLIAGAATNLGNVTSYYAILTESSGACSDIDTIGPFTFTKVSGTPTVTITSSPLDVCQLETATYTATVTAPSPANNLVYNWYNAPNGGGFGLQRTTTTTSTTDAYSYTAQARDDQDRVYVRVTNICGTTNSDTVTLDVNPKPIVTVPASMSTISACEGDGFNVTYSIDTAEYQNRAGSVDWTIHRSGDADLYNLLDTTGNGNTTVNLVGIGTALTPGVYEVTFTGVTNTTDNCTRAISTNTINVTIYPKPVITFEITPSDYCQGTDTTSFKIRVTNAQYNNGGSPVNVNWSASVTQSSVNVGGNCTSGNAGLSLGSTFSGTGDGVFYFYPSTNLSPGDYKYTINSITNTSNACAGTVVTDVAEWSVRPRPTISVAPTSTAVCQGQSTNFDINVTNAEYCLAGAVTDADWSLTFTDGTGSGIGGSPLTGSGNGTTGPYTTDAALGQGTYVFDPGVITNTTAGHGACARTISGNTFTLTVNPTPQVTFSTDTIRQCQGTSGTSFDMIVSNSVLNSVDQNWSVSYTATGASALSGTPCTAGSPAGIITGGQTGAGNISRTFNIPTGLSPGVYRYDLNSITNTSSGCVTSPSSASAGPVDSIIIIIDPNPVITMNPDIKSVCENGAETFNLQVTNTKGCDDIGSSYDSEWSLTGVTDNVDSDLSGLAWYPDSVGNAAMVINVNTSFGLSADDASLVASVYNTTANSTCVIGNANIDSFVLSVDPRPEVQINGAAGAQTINVCEGEIDSFMFSVTNAEQNGSGIPWEITYSESSGNLTTSCVNSVNRDLPGASGSYTGTGSDDYYIQVPSNLPVGRYTYTVSNIVSTKYTTNISHGPCTGFVDGVQLGTQTITINVYPKPQFTITPKKDSVCENSMLVNAFSINVTNAKYCSAANTISDIDYDIYYTTDDVASSVGGSPYSGSGNTNHSFNANVGTALTAGSYKFKTDSIKLTGVPNTCVNVQVDSFELTVDPEPTAAFTASSIDVCEKDSGTFFIEVGNAVLNSVDVNWEITVSESSGNITTSCSNIGAANATMVPTSVTGAGNKSGASLLAFGVPTTTTPGRYVYTINTIENTDAGCVTTVTSSNTIVVNVYPKPSLTISPADDEVCENSVLTNAFDIQVTNARYCSAANAISDVSYEIAYSDNVASNVGGSPYTNSGNGTWSFNANVGAGLGEGTYVFETSTLTTTGLSTNCSSSQIDSFELTVNPEPIATFTSDEVVICEGNVDSIGITVSNAELNGNPINWEMVVSEFAGNIPTSCILSVSAQANVVPDNISSSGNRTTYYTIPNNLDPGVYIYVINSIDNVSDNCDGSVTPLDSVTVYVYPKIEVAVSPDTTEVCEGDNAQFEIQVSNANYCSAINVASTNVAWTMPYTDNTNSNIFPDPLTGSGPSNFTFTANNGGLLGAGYYTFKADSILYTTPAACDFALTTDNEFVLQVNPEPVVTWNASSLTVCEGDVDSFFLEVTNASLGSTGVDWEIFVEDEDGLVSNSCATSGITTTKVSGNGNDTIAIVLPANLGVGVYRFRLDSIANITPPCVGLVGTNPVITVTVFPKPDVDLSVDSLTVCENTDASFDLDVTNAQYCASIGGSLINVGWEITHNDATDSDIPASVWVGSGNQTGLNYSVNITPNLTQPGPYFFDIDNIKNTTHNCVNSDSFSGNELVLTVNDLPVATITRVTSDTCTNDPARIDWKVEDVDSLDSWTFDYTANGSTTAITGTGPDSGFVYTTAYTIPGVKGISYSAITNTTTGCIGNTPGAGSVNILALPDVTSFGPTASNTICAGLTNNYDLNIINATGRGWQVSYTIDGVAQTPWTGTGNGTFTRAIANQYYQNATGAAETRDIEITEIIWTTGTPICGSNTVTDADADVKVNPRPSITLNAPDNVCVNFTAEVEYTVFGVGAGQGWDFDWETTGPTDGPNNETGTGSVTDTFTTVQLNPVGTSTVFVQTITNTTTGCDSSNSNWIDSMTVDPPSDAGTLDSSYTICDGDVGPFNFKLRNYVGVVQHWDSSENGGYIWFNIGNDSSDTYSVVSPHLTTNYQVVVKSGACPADTSNDVVLFVHPQPSSTLVSVTDSICAGSNIDVVFEVSGVPNTHTWDVDYSVQIGASAPTTGTWTGTGSSATITKTLTNGGSGFSSGPVTVTLISITNNKTGCDTTLNDSKVTKVKSAPNGSTASTDQVLCHNSNGIVVWDGTAADGYVVAWQKKVGSGSWSTITGSAGDTLEFTGLTTTTSYRAVIENAPCSGQAFSSAATMTVVATNPTAGFINLPSSNRFCASATNTTTLSYNVLGTNTNNWTLTLLEGDSLHTINGNGDDTLTFTTSAGKMQSTFDVTLVKLVISFSSTTCTKNLDNTAKAVITVIDLPSASITSLTTPVCDGDSVTMTYSVSNIKSTENWSLVYSIDGNSKTLTGTGPTTSTYKIPHTVSGGNATQTVSLTSITNTSINNSAGSSCSNTLSGQSRNYVARSATSPGTIGSNATVCIGASGAVAQTAASSNGSVIIGWESSEWNGSSWSNWASTGNTTASQSYTNIQNTTRFKAIYSNSPCDTAGSSIVTITVRPLPTATLSLTSGNDTICEGNTSNVVLTVSNIDNGQSFTINYVEGSVSKSKSFTNNSTSVHTFATGTITSTTDLTLSSIATTSGVTCSNSSLNSTVSITVQEKPTGTIASYDSPLCNGETVDYTITIGNVGSTDGWTARLTLDGNSETVKGTGTGTFSATTTNTVTSTSDNLILVSVTNDSTQDACVNTINQSKTITVAAPTVAGTIGSDVTVCKGASGSISQSTSGTGTISYWLTRSHNGSSWGSWSSIGNTATTQTYTSLQNTTQYRAVYTNSPCDTAGSNTVTVTVRELPTLALSLTTGNDTICAGQKTTVNITVGNIVSGQTFRIDYTEGSSTKQKTFTHNGSSTYTFQTDALTSTTVISADMIQTTSGVTCSNSSLNSSITVTVQENPTATIASYDKVLCHGSTVDFAVTTGNLGTADKWELEMHLDGNTEVVSGTGPGTFSFTTTATVTAHSDVLGLDSIYNLGTQDVCYKLLTETKTIKVDTTTVPGLIGTAAVSSDTTICLGGSAQIVEYVAGTGSILKWQSRVNSSSAWVDINSTSSVINRYNINDTTSFRAIYQNGVCTSSASAPVTVNPKDLPLAIISNVIDDSICAGTTADFEITVTNVSAGQNFNLSYKEGSVNRSASLTQNASGVHTLTTGTLTASSQIQLTSISVTSGHPRCTDSLTSNGTVTVLSLPFATVATGPDTLCQQDKIVFTVNVSNVASTDNWKLIYELESDLDTITGTGPGNFTRVDTDANSAQSAKIQLLEILNLSNLGTCKSVNTDDWDIYIYAPTEPGDIGDNDTICKGGSTTISEVTGTPKQGVTVSWEYKPQSASNWTGLNNNSTTLNVINLQETTHYRAVYKSGVCDTAHSNVITITVRELPVATISGSTSICSGDSTNLTINVSNVGSSQDWIIDYLVGTQYRTITGTGNGNHTLRVGNFMSTTDVTLREISTTSLIPQCTNDRLTNKATATVSINQRPFASLNGTTSPVCQGSTSSFSVTVSNVRSSEKWTLTYDVDDAVFGSTLTGTGPGTYTVTTPSLSTSKTYNVDLLNITNNTTGCDSNLSSTMGIVVDATTQAGSVASDTTVCFAAHVGTVTHTGGNGSIIRWETSLDNGTSWATITNTSGSYTYSNLTKTSLFRVVKQNGVCTELATSPITVTVNSLPVATVGGSDTICAGTSGTLTVNATNTQGENWMLSYLVGARLDTISVTGPLTSATINTGTLSKTTDVTLKKIWMTSGAPQCVNDNLTNNATGTVEVEDLPAATLISLTDSVCTGNPADGKATIANVRSYEGWKMYWTINGGGTDSTSGTGAGSFNFTTNNLTASPSTLRLVRIVNLSTGCDFRPTDEDSVIVSPVTVGGTLSGVDTVCTSDNSGTLTLGSDARGNVQRWEYSTDGGKTWSTLSNTASTYTYNNIANTTWYRVLVQNGVCAAEYSSTVEIKVNPLPVAAITSVGASNICEGSSTFVALNITNVGTGMNWELKYLQGSAVKTLTGSGPGADTIFTGSLNTTTDITLQTLKITSGSPRCENTSITNNYTTTITVIDNPTATITNYPSNICKGETPTVTILVDDVKTGQSWTAVYRVNNGSNRTSTGVGSGQFNLNNMPVFSKEGPNGVRLVSITNTSSNPNCTGQLSDSVTIMVDSLSVGGSISGVSTVCYGEDGTLALNGERGDVVKWQYSTDGINYYDIANTSDSLNFSNLTVRTWYRAVVQNGVCDVANSSVKVVNVQELPTVTIVNGTQTICSGSSTSLSLTIGNVSSTSTWTINYTENGSSGSTAGGTGTSGTIAFGPYTQTTTIEITGITVTNGFGCSNTISQKAVITVTPNPTATINTVPDSLCEDDVLTFTVAVDDVATGTGWDLDYSIDGISAATKSGTGPGTFTVNSSRKVSPNNAKIKLSSIELTTALGCSSVLTDSATIKVTPTSVGGTVAGTSIICQGDNATLTLSGETGAVMNWEYSTDGGSSWTVLSNNGKTLTVSNVTVTTLYRAFVKSGPCSGAFSSSATITVIETPTATVSGSDKVCPGDAATFTLSVNNVAAGQGWSVVYRRNGTVVSTPVTGTGSGDFTFTVTGATYNGNPTFITVELVSITNTTHACVNNSLTSSATARVTPNPVANFTAANECQDSMVTFINTSTIPEGTITSTKWYFGDGDSSVNATTTHTYSAAGNYSVRMVVWSDNGCRSEITKTITIYPKPVANFTAANVCKNSLFTPIDGSTVSSGNITDWNWSFGDGSSSTGQAPTHTYATSGNFDVTLTVTTNNGCTNTITKTITVYILPEANFVATPVCENNAMDFVNASAIGYGTMTYEWNFAGQGNSAAKDPSFTFTGFGTFGIELIATSNHGCKDTINRNVTVHPEPTASFTVASVCIGETSSFVNTSTIPSGNIVEYFWNFGDQNFSGLQNPTHTYANPGSYTVTLRVKSASGCENTFTTQAEVIDLPEVQLTANGPTSFCDGDSVILSANPNARDYDWSWPAGTSTDATVTAKTTGWYKVRITAAPIGCANEDSIFVNVWSLPDAQAWPRNKVSQSIDTIQKGQSIDLHASGGVNYSWDPTTYLNSVTTPDVIAEQVNEDISYTVTVTDINGCVNTAQVTVIVLDQFDLTVYNAVTPNGDGMNDTWIVENIWAYPDAEVVIFNRYGMEVFTTVGYNNEWGGTYQKTGEDLPDGPYYYVITHPNFPDTVYKGVINVIRERK